MLNFSRVRRSSFWLAILVLHLANGCLAQTSLSPAAEAYDKAAPPLPTNYPAKDYSAEALMSSLVALANSKSPSLGDVEREFGIRFVDGWARGRSPLGNRLSNAHGREVVTSLSLNFENELTALEQQQLRRSTLNTCVDAHALARRFTADGWRVIVRVMGGIPVPSFAKQINGDTREVQFAPLSDDFARQGRGDCVVAMTYFFKFPFNR